MMELLFFLLGIAIAAPITALHIRRKHGEKMRADATKYEDLYKGALDLMSSGGMITDDQLKRLMPAQSTGATKLPQGTGISAHRRDIEIARARQGLPPADNLEGMISAHVRDVERARIKHKTAV